MDFGIWARRLLPAGTLMVLLAGCVTGEELARRQAEQRQRQLDEDRQTCMAYGIHPSQSAFAGCMFQLDRDRKDRAQQEEMERQAREAEERRQEAHELARNGQCDDPRYRTSNGGRAERGTDEYECRVLGLGDGRK